MRARLLLTIATAAVIACGPPEELPGEELQTRTDEIRAGTINNGDPQVFVIIMEWPSGSRALCTATLIDRRTLLTAAHCVDTVEGHYPSKIVATNLTQRPPLSETDKWTTAVRSVVHPDWVMSELAVAADVALIELPQFPMIKPKPWNRISLSNTTGGMVRATGYGITERDANDSGTKRQVNMQIRSITRTHVTIATGEISGICSGDSGGPSFYTFPDGLERQMSIHSYGSGLLNCRGGTDARTDYHVAFINQFLEEAEVPRCEADSRCKEGCTEPDPDCACTADGSCNASCSGVSVDPDCEAACAQNGICGTACAAADPDCYAPFTACHSAEDCATRVCVSDPQSYSTYCSKACAGAADCPDGFECSEGACKHRQLPAAGEGEACTFNETYCTANSVCTALEGEDTVCTRPCLDDIACDSGERCEPAQNGVSICVAPPPPEEEGCGCKSTSPAAVLPGALLAFALGLARRRTRSAVHQGTR